MKIIEMINIKKRELFFGIFVAALSSVGLTYIADYFVSEKSLSLYIGIIIMGLVLVVCLISFVPFWRTSISSNAIFAIRKDGTFPNVFEYLCLSNIYGYLEACISENETFKKMWLSSFSEFEHKLDDDAQTIVDRINDSIPDSYTFLLKLDTEPVIPDASILLKDAIECEFLDWLSRISNELYLAKNDVEMVYIGRNENAAYMMQNKVLDLLSRDISDRAKFVNVNILKADLKYIHSLTDKNTGITYEKFEILLPKGTTINRNESGMLVIKNGYYKISFTVTFNTGREQLPSGYSELILKENASVMNVFSVPVTVDIKLNLWRLMTGMYSSRFNILNKLTSEFERHFSFGAHLNRIGFNEARSVMYMIRPKVQKHE